MPNNLPTVLRNFIVANFLYGQERELQDSASLMGEGIIDSTGVLQLISFIEETYELTVADDEIIPENLDSIEKIAAYLVRKLPNTSAASFNDVATGGNV